MPLSSRRAGTKSKLDGAVAGAFVPAAAKEPTRFGIRIVLIAGFGGLIAIMAAAGIYSLRISKEIQRTSTQLRNDYLSRERLLEEIRSNLFESGNIARDYLLVGPDQPGAAELRRDLKTSRNNMESELQSYIQSLRPGEQQQFEKLQTELEDYWRTLNPIFEGKIKEARDPDYLSLRNELLSRRTNLLAIAGDIGEVNKRALIDDEARIADTFSRFQRRLQIITVLGLCLSLVLVVITLAYTLHLEELSDQRYSQSVAAQQELQQLSARLVDAQESERREISRELHDEVGQSMGALLMEIDRVATIDGAAHGEMQTSIEKLKSLAEGTLNVVRNMSLLLRPSMLDDLGLIPALEWQAREVSRRTGLSVNVVDEEVSDALPEECKTCIYRVVQEALNNCVKHAQANRVAVIVRQDPSRIMLTIQDDGKGFDTRRVRGLGLVGMAERVHRLHGTLKIESNEGCGTVLRIELPVAENTAAAGTVFS